MEFPGLELGERCDVVDDKEDDDNDGDDDDDEETTGRSASSRDKSEDSTGRGRRRLRIRGRISGARERLVYGQLQEAQVECQEGLVCAEVEGEDRRECQPENDNGDIHSTVRNLFLIALSLSRDMCDSSRGVPISQLFP